MLLVAHKQNIAWSPEVRLPIHRGAPEVEEGLSIRARQKGRAEQDTGRLLSTQTTKNHALPHYALARQR